jgi:hypothetical protein
VTRTVTTQIDAAVIKTPIELRKRGRTSPSEDTAQRFLNYLVTIQPMRHYSVLYMREPEGRLCALCVPVVEKESVGD